MDSTKSGLIDIYYTNLEDDKITELYKKDLIDSNFEILDDLINDFDINSNELENENNKEELETDNSMDYGEQEIDIEEKEDDGINSNKPKKIYKD